MNKKSFPHLHKFKNFENIIKNIMIIPLNFDIFIDLYSEKPYNSGAYVTVYKKLIFGGVIHEKNISTKQKKKSKNSWF